MGLSAGRSLATAYGNNGNSITLEVSQLPAHNHSVSGLTTTPAGEHSHQAGGDWGLMIRSSASSTSTGSLRIHAPYTGSSGTTLGVGRTATQSAHTHSVAGNTANTGSGTGINIEPRNYQVKYYIKYA